MYFCRNIFFISVFYIIYVNSTSSDINIREKGSSSNSSTVQKATNHTILSVNNTQKPIFASQQNVPSGPIQVASEGGGSISSTAGTHDGRENVVDQPLTKTVISKDKEPSISHSTQPQDNKPNNESVKANKEVAPKQDFEKPSVPKKGVEENNIKLNVSSPTTTNSSIEFHKKVSNLTYNHASSTNATVVHKKPLFTESDTDFVNMSKSNEDTAKETVISIDQVDPLLVDKKSKRSDYIVPIVAVILSVPLVAILASILYKRGTDWWQHRNYKRMDFLIEGMYHN